MIVSLAVYTLLSSVLLCLGPIFQKVMTSSYELYSPSFVNNFSKNNLYVFANPSARAGYDTRSIFKQSLKGLD